MCLMDQRHSQLLDKSANTSVQTPDRLPRAYNKWITSAAAVDARLLTALRRTRFGEMVYGVETGEAHVLQDMCKDYGWPVEYGDPVKSIPFPCEVVHMGTGKSCEYHALSRLIKSFWWAFSTYLPINLLLTLRKPSKSSVKHAFISSARSSAFLGSFIALYYYGICLTRSRLGPKILGTSTPACRRIDSGLCVGGGCALCGWSVMIENAGRRKELGLFVAPRALATIFPRRYLLENQWRETMAFAISAAVVFTALGENPKRVRGVFGKVCGIRISRWDQFGLMNWRYVNRALHRLLVSRWPPSDELGPKSIRTRAKLTCPTDHGIRSCTLRGETYEAVAFPHETRDWIEAVESL